MKHAQDFNIQPLFITLTYDDDHITYGSLNPTLVKRDLQLFFKRLRSKLPKRKISYFAVGEYGTKFKRPHYHAILYGVARSEYDVLIRAWDMGFVHIGKLSERSVNYVAKYHVLRGIHPQGSAPSFSVSSHHLGGNYLRAMREWHRDDPVNRDFIWHNGKQVSLPRYYRNKIFDEVTREHLNHLKSMKYKPPEGQPERLTREWYTYIEQISDAFYRKKAEKGIF